MTSARAVSGADRARCRLVVHGVVQGVGFRPCVFRLAGELGLAGWVGNDGDGVTIEVEGPERAVAAFRARLRSEGPAHASFHRLETTHLEPCGFTSFAIRGSGGSGPPTTLVPPDIATCADCLRELFDPRDRRHRYPFINCTNCGPRYSIVHALPYDRPRTSMRAFPMCASCLAEYGNPADRRFHAQPIACPECGPSLSLWDAGGTTLARFDAALTACARAIRSGSIVAVKGLGGFHLVCDARSDRAVGRLRRAKHRPEKPLAIMLGSPAAVRDICHVSAAEEAMLRSPAGPIVLLDRRRNRPGVAEAVAPGHPGLGVMLPYTPLHYLLLAELGFPIVATSGNRSDEPLCIDEREAIDRLAGLADLYLVHDRPIVRPVDDSVMRVVAGREQVLRRARGLAPLPIRVKTNLPPLLAVGGHQKSSVAISVGHNVFVSQHLGDLDTVEARQGFERAVQDLAELYGHEPCAVVCDEHPEYASTRYAERRVEPIARVQHHVAHVLSCMAENELEGPVLGIAWDGTGWGPDRTVWGGEFLRVDRGVERVAHLRPFGLPGGEPAVREPRRSAVAVLAEALGHDSLDAVGPPPGLGWRPEQWAVLSQMLRRGVNSPHTSSAGRLFDAVASLLDIRQVCSFEGQAAMELEHAAAQAGANTAYPIELHGPVLDWRPAIRSVLAQRSAGVDRGTVAARFHQTLVEGIALVAGRTGLERVVMSGGCFQNRLLLERTISRLREDGFAPYWHQRLPPNDGGLALGQIVAAAPHLSRRGR